MNTFLSASRLPLNRSRRGSILMVALVLAAVLAISLTSYLKLVSHSAKMANRSFYMDGAQNLCDTGMEIALWCMNNSNWGGAGFTQISANQYRGTYPTTGTQSFSGGVTGQVKTWVDLTNAARPHVVTKATITLADGSTISKYAEAYMKRSSYFDDGVVGDTLDLNGRTDSWNSDPDADGLNPVAYDPSHPNANAHVAATSTAIRADDIGQGIIAGTAAAGSASGQSGIYIGAQGIVGDNTYIGNSANRGTIQADHATYDFVADFPDATNPTIPALSSSGGAYSAPTLPNADTTLPRGGDQRASDGVYYYYINQLTLTGNTDTMQITAGTNVVVIVTNTGNQSVSVGGNCPGIVLGSNASLKLYTAGDVSVAGNGITNGTATQTGSGPSSYNTVGQPIKFQIYGTRSTADIATSGTQRIDVGGNGYLSGVIYAPNADVHINGNGHVFGAVVGQQVTFSGNNVRFHVDESLQDTLTTGLWEVRKWRELSVESDRAVYESNLTF